MKKGCKIVLVLLAISLIFLISCMQKPICGNKFCEFGETKDYCPYDCGTKDKTLCGDGFCDLNEDASTCPQDCQAVTKCGDGSCSVGEDENNCAIDCKKIVQNICGDSKCDANEDSLSCAQDCPITSAQYCGDGEVNQAEECEPKNHAFNLNCFILGKQNCDDKCKCQGTLTTTQGMPQDPQELVKDTDNGGLPDWIEKLLNSNINDATDDEQDQDKDEFTDLQEYISETNITDQNNHP